MLLTSKFVNIVHILWMLLVHMSCLLLVLSIIHVTCNASYFFSLIFLGEFKQSFARFLFKNTDTQSRLELAFWSLRVKEQIEDGKLLKPISYKFQEESIEIVFEWKSKLKMENPLNPFLINSWKNQEESFSFRGFLLLIGLQ